MGPRFRGDDGNGRNYASLPDLHRRAGVSAAALERLAEADAFRSLGLDRRRALWAVRGLAETPLPLFAAAETSEPAVALPAMNEARAVVEDYRATGVSLRRHPVSFLRDALAKRRIIPCARLDTVRDGQRVSVAGLVLVRQKPGSAHGVLFMTIEDETGIANLIVWPSLFERQRRVVLSAGMLACHGRVQKEGIVIHVVADRLEDLSAMLRGLGQTQLTVPLGGGDQPTHGSGPDPRERGEGIKVPTRDFR